MHRLLKVSLTAPVLGAAVLVGCWKNEPPGVPSTPSGPDSAWTGAGCTFSSSAEDPDGDSVAIRFDWDDGGTSDWSPYVLSGETVAAGHSWADSGTYSVKAQARDQEDSASDWSAGHQIEISTGGQNEPPDAPSAPYGPETGSVDTEYAFVSTAADPDGDSVAIRFDWGGGDTSNWSSWAASGDTISMKHSWSDSGTYLIRAQARDTKDGTSDWSIGHQMAISGGGNGGWIRTFGGDSWDVGYSVQQTTDGGYIIAGITQSYGAGETDAYLIKTDSRGNQSWYRTFGGISWDPSYSVQQTTDGGYVLTGSTGSYGVNGDVRLIKTDAGGDTLWTRTFGDLSIDFGYSGQQTEDGGYIVAGTQYWDVGSTDVYLVKTDANGNLTWSQTYGGPSEDWGRSVRQTTDGGYVIAGDTKSYGAGEEDAYLVKTAADGGLTWSQTFGGPNRDYAASVRQTADGGYIIAGVTFSYGVGSGDVYLIKTDASGNQTWFKTFGGSAADHGYSVQQTADGGYIIVGWTHSYGAGDADVYLIKTDASGNETWFKTFGGSAADRGYSVQQTADGGYIVAGETFSYGEGLGDVYLIKTDANGNVE